NVVVPFIRFFIVLFRHKNAPSHVQHLLREFSRLPVLVLLAIFFQQFPVLPPHGEAERGAFHLVAAHHVRLFVLWKRLAFLADVQRVSSAREALVGLVAAAYLAVVSAVFPFLLHHVTHPFPAKPFLVR